MLFNGKSISKLLLAWPILCFGPNLEAKTKSLIYPNILWPTTSIHFCILDPKDSEFNHFIDLTNDKNKEIIKVAQTLPPKYRELFGKVLKSSFSESTELSDFKLFLDDKCSYTSDVYIAYLKSEEAEFSADLGNALNIWGKKNFMVINQGLMNLKEKEMSEFTDWRLKRNIEMNNEIKTKQERFIDDAISYSFSHEVLHVLGLGHGLYNTELADLVTKFTDDPKTDWDDDDTLIEFASIFNKYYQKWDLYIDHSVSMTIGSSAVEEYFSTGDSGDSGDSVDKFSDFMELESGPLSSMSYFYSLQNLAYLKIYTICHSKNLGILIADRNDQKILCDETLLSEIYHFEKNGQYVQRNEKILLLRGYFPHNSAKKKLAEEWESKQKEVNIQIGDWFKVAKKYVGLYL
ncbi:MAG: hypothetical protein QE271_13335 [Bacteriovoracaceae bacterium]|nr:hypothetical protein [Bacteriovoracaceae bacterium]